MCPSGFTCPDGINVETCTDDFCKSGAGGNANCADAGECPGGYRCPENSKEPIPCEAGTFSPDGTTDECTACRAGHFCPIATSEIQMINNFECQNGYYCPFGTKSAIEFPCPKGKLGDGTGLSSPDQCIDCPAGQYCEQPGGTSSTGPCAPGYKCPAGTNAETARPSDSLCDVGYVCGEGTENDGQECSEGFYCPRKGMTPDDIADSLDTFKCNPGYECGIGVITGRPMIDAAENCRDGAGAGCGQLCRAGHYCDIGTKLGQSIANGGPVPCPDKFYYSGTGARTEADCIPCLAGFKCDWSSLGNVLPVDPEQSTQCQPGFYCRDGEEIPCPVGHYCPTIGLGSPLACPPGTYQDGTESQTCNLCPEGYFCSDVNGPIAIDPTSDPSLLCPVGYYCEAGTYNQFQNPCPRGTYGDVTGLIGDSEDSFGDNGCKACWPGKVCDKQGMTAADQTNTINCAPGIYCAGGAKHILDGEECQLGHFCPAGMTAYDTSNMCPPNTFGKRTGLQKIEHCSPCPGGKVCSDAGLTETLLQDTQYDCPAGSYCNPSITGSIQTCPRGHRCPERQDRPIPCEIGYYQENPGQEECEPCPAGKVCNSRGMDSNSLEPCPIGWYCPEGSHSTCSPEYDPVNCNATVTNMKLCEIGHYCPGDVANQIPCEAGKWALSFGQSSCDDCPAGMFCDGTGYLPCPVGKYCGIAETNPTDCPAGTYSQSNFITFDDSSGQSFNFGLKSASECTPCPGGQYCIGGSNPPESCADGEYCQFGVRAPGIGNPDPGRDSSCDLSHPFPELGGRCEAGFQCDTPPTAIQVPCPAGSYGTDGTSCEPCPAGYYCPIGSTSGTNTDTDYDQNPCPAGYYCEVGTADFRDTPCPAGQYSEVTLLRSVDGCELCPAQKYCPTRAAGDQVNPEGDYQNNDCAPGHYCLRGSAHQKPNDIFANNENFGYCEAGFKCPAGATAPVLCDNGEVCDRNFISGDGDGVEVCPPGFFCSTSTTEITTDLLCGAGLYCSEGTTTTETCPSTTLPEGVGLVTEDECQTCPRGSICNNCSAGSDCNPRNCSPGRKCEDGVEVDCPEGHFCPNTVPIEQPCNLNEYSEGGNSVTSCDACPAGKDCSLADVMDGHSQVCQEDQDSDTRTIICEGGDPAKDLELAVSNPADCPVGYFCGQGRKDPCGRGTYNAGTERETQCDDLCAEGFFCSSFGNSDPEGDGICADGFSCNAGSESRTESFCPKGSYCSGGQVNPCIAGTYTDSMGNVEPEDCLACAAGQFCSNGEENPCRAGTICKGGRDNNNGENCAPGATCEQNTVDGVIWGAVISIACPVGEYLDGSNGCQTCPEGQFCGGVTNSALNSFQGTASPENCPLGFICEEGTGFIQSADGCDIGSYMDVNGNCISCPASSACSTYRDDAITESCAVGHYCPEGTKLPTENKCGPGQYCEGTDLTDDTDGILCLKGTYYNQYGGEDVSVCQPCPGGWICSEDGLILPNIQCPAGKYCGEGLDNPDESLLPDCPINYFCTIGSSTPKPCGPGTYQDTSGQSECKDCPAGSYCDGTPNAFESIDINPLIQPIECPAHHFCSAASSAPSICSPGRYTESIESGLSADTDCTDCPTGKYCRGGRIAGDCASGYLCITRNSSPTPLNVAANVGRPCSIGYYCPVGTTRELDCPSGLVIATSGAKDVQECDLCSEGSFCPPVSTGPVVEVPCPAGNYCPYGRNDSSIPVPCPVGTYSDVTENKSLQDCLICPLGFNCDAEGISNIQARVSYLKIQYNIFSNIISHHN